ncbi:G-type lectin S-receptor-like serine/threonine-protein kinase LECRK1 [Glycine max]|nr:G-type lectin S-receptor-like serine/threonine-protein kinase LECRK1 [Glycine max]
MASPTLFFIFSLVFLHVMFVLGNITLSSTLSTNDNDAWLSPSGEFAFGFRQLNSTNLFVVAIWYDKIPAKTIVWNAKANETLATAPAGSQVQLTLEGLTLTSPKGESIWKAQPSVPLSYGAMLDTGNFVLVNKNPTSRTNMGQLKATLEFNGVFTQYAHPRTNNAYQGWTIMRYVPGNICTAIFNEYGSGSCGYNSYCSMENDRPTCKCPYGYSMVDPSNEFGGCQPNFTLACGVDVKAQPEELYEMHEFRDFNFPLGDYEKKQPYSQQECRQSCLHDCMCAMAVLGGNTCWMKRLPLSNGRVIHVNDQHFVYIKTRVRRDFYDPGANEELPPGADSKKEDGAKPILLGSLIGSLVFISISMLLCAVSWFILLKPKLTRLVPAIPSLLETNLHSFTYETLEKATRGFCEEIGRGSFGIVYKGQLEAASCNVIAVKRLDRLAQEREKEFRTELSAIGKTCHKNLVRLIGFCDEGINRLLVYEFMSNGTLADILFGQSKAPIWNTRVGLALGIARGLLYLHEECDSAIIHCDIKPQNILIDEHFNAKISDFGLAKLLLFDQTRTNTMIRGTRGYVAPEWFKNIAVTVKVDVYSFGVMLLEIICCRRNVLTMEAEEEEKVILTDWAYDCYIEGRNIDALVENDKEALSDNGRLEKWIKIAFWCINENPEVRPTMGMVMLMLEGFVEVPNPPPPFSMHSIS